jgi:hypothetical protein
MAQMQTRLKRSEEGRDLYVRRVESGVHVRLVDAEGMREAVLTPDEVRWLALSALPAVIDGGKPRGVK